MSFRQSSHYGPLSLNELLFFVTRATAGVGTPFGAGEESGRAAQTLAKAGCDPAPLLVRVLGNLQSKACSTRLHIRDEPSGMCFAAETQDAARPLSALCAGITAGDWLLADAEQQKIKIGLEQLDCPQFAAAVVLSIAQSAGQSARFYVEAGEGGAGIHPVSLADVPSKGPADLTVELAEPTAAGATHQVYAAENPNWDGVLVEAAAWDKILGYFHRCLVPSTEQSRLSGAGAGLVDED